MANGWTHKSSPYAAYDQPRWNNSPSEVWYRGVRAGQIWYGGQKIWDSKITFWRWAGTQCGGNFFSRERYFQQYIPSLPIGQATWNTKSFSISANNLNPHFTGRLNSAELNSFSLEMECVDDIAGDWRRTGSTGYSVATVKSAAVRVPPGAYSVNTSEGWYTTYSASKASVTYATTIILQSDDGGEVAAYAHSVYDGLVSSDTTTKNYITVPPPGGVLYALTKPVYDVKDRFGLEAGSKKTVGGRITVQRRTAYRGETVRAGQIRSPLRRTDTGDWFTYLLDDRQEALDGAQTLWNIDPTVFYDPDIDGYREITSFEYDLSNLRYTVKYEKDTGGTGTWYIYFEDDAVYYCLRSYGRGSRYISGSAKYVFEYQTAAALS